MTKELFIRLCLRFARAFVAGAIATMTAIVPMASNGNWQDFRVWLSALALAGLIGGITGLVQALGLYFRNS